MKRLGVCPECEHHFYVSAQQRIIQVLDTGTFEELDAGPDANGSVGIRRQKEIRRPLSC